MTPGADSTSPARSGEPTGTAVILGAAGGLGGGLAKLYLERGWNLALCDIERASLVDASQCLAQTHGVEVEAYVVDVTKPEELVQVRRVVEARFGGIDLVFNTVAVTKQNPVMTTPVLDWRWILEVNFYGALNVSNAFLPALQNSNAGLLVHTSSTTAVAPGRPDSGPYLVSKHAVIALCEALQQDLRKAGSGIRVAVALPGTVRSNIASSERNRQAEFGPGAPRDEAVDELQRYLQDKGVDGYVLAKRIVEQLDERRFYLFGRDQDFEVVTARYESIMSGVLPPFGQPAVAIRDVPTRRGNQEHSA